MIFSKKKKSKNVNYECRILFLKIYEETRKQFISTIKMRIMPIFYVAKGFKNLEYNHECNIKAIVIRCNTQHSERLNSKEVIIICFYFHFHNFIFQWHL